MTHPFEVDDKASNDIIIKRAHEAGGREQHRIRKQLNIILLRSLGE